MAEWGMTSITQRISHELDFPLQFLNDNMNPHLDKNSTEIKSTANIYVKQMNKLTNFPWGSSVTVTGNENSDTKVIIYNVKPKHLIPKTKHMWKSKHIIIIEGFAEFNINNDTVSLSKNGHLFIPNETEHLIQNTHNTSYMTFYEIQIGIKRPDGNYYLSDLDM